MSNDGGTGPEAPTKRRRGRRRKVVGVGRLRRRNRACAGAAGHGNGRADIAADPGRTERHGTCATATAAPTVKLVPLPAVPGASVTTSGACAAFSATTPTDVLVASK